MLDLTGKLALAILILICGCSIGWSQVQTGPASNIVTQPSDTLDTATRALLELRVRRILEKDQQFRGYLTYETTDDAEITRYATMEIRDAVAAIAKNRGRMSGDVKALLQQLQQKNDRENLADFISIVRQHGYPSPERIGLNTDDELFAMLLHPPVEPDQIDSHLEQMSALLLPEVQAGRMKPQLFATFVDNLLAKILGRPQRFGTNSSFDPETNSIAPPGIVDLAATNQARRAIGLPELKDGEYRLVPAPER